MRKTFCPECDTVVRVRDPRMGYLFNCPECGIELEVISIEPFHVSFPPDENWDEDKDQKED